MTKINQTPIIITAIIVIGVLVALFSFIPRTSERVIDVTGNSQFTVQPDKAVVYVQVLTKAETADAAKNMNAETSSKVLAALDAIGIAKTDVETENYNIYQDCEWTQDGQKCKGFAASNNIKVSSKDFNNVGKIVDAAVDNGGLISYINFELSTEKSNEYKAQALKLASEDAKTKADAVASGQGKKAGKLVSISASDYGYAPYPLYARAEGGIASDVKQAVTSIQPKSLDISASVTARYEIS